MILISNTYSNYLESVMTVLHEKSIPYKIINIEDIIMYYDIYKPLKIFLSKKDKTNSAVKALVKENKNIVQYETDNLLLNTDIVTKCDKNNNIALFLDYNEIPDNASLLLAPNKFLPIHIFNCSIKHPQNSGKINCLERLEIIKKYNGVITFNNHYKKECLLSGTFHYNINTVTEEDVKECLNKTISPQKINSTRTYQNHLEDLLYE